MINQNIIRKDFDDVIFYNSTQFKDERGFFQESYKESFFKSLGINVKFVQDNMSKSIDNVFRGMHFQTIHKQAKLVSCPFGHVIDFVMDIDKNSKTFGEIKGYHLNKPNVFLYIPAGYAHGFLTLTDSFFQYKVSDYRYTEEERSVSILNYFNNKIKIPVYDDDMNEYENTFDINNLIMSDKDKNAKEIKFIDEII